MGYSWQIKPKDSMSLPFLTYAPSNIIYRTIGQIKNYLRAKGYNAALLTWDTKGGYNGYMIITNFGNINSDLHLATDVYFGKSNYTIGYPKPASGRVEQTWMFYVYNDGSGIVNQTGSVWNNFAETKTVDGITYWTPKNPSSEHPPIYVTTYDGNIYYHGDVPLMANWKSVRSVSGKGKTYILTKYLNINDGDPVNNVSYVNNVDVSAKSKVNNMVDDVIVDGGKVTVRYTIPAGSYSYIKLVYKKNGIPASYSDGTAVDITQSSTSKVFDRLDFKDTAVYWFAIFTDKSTSEPVSLDLKGYNPVPAEYQDYIDLINGVQPFKYQYALTDNWVTTLTAENAKYGSAPNYATLTEPAKNASYIFCETVSIDTWNQSAQHHLYVSTKENASYNYDPVMSTGRCDYCVEPFSVNIIGSGDSYSYTISNLVRKPIWRTGKNTYASTVAPRWNQAESKWQYHAYFNEDTGAIPSRLFSGTLEQCLKMLAMQVRNVDLYVNGELWSRKVS